MTTPAEYRQLALECMREAEGADHPLMRSNMMGLARIWMRLALESGERFDEASREASVPPGT